MKLVSMHDEMAYSLYQIFKEIYDPKISKPFLVMYVINIFKIFNCNKLFNFIYVNSSHLTLLNPPVQFLYSWSLPASAWVHSSVTEAALKSFHDNKHRHP